MRFYTSLHVQVPDKYAVRSVLGSLLEPGLDAYLVESFGWTSVYAARLEEQDPAELARAARPLSELGRAVGFMVHDDQALAVMAFERGESIASYADDPAAFGLPDDASRDPAALAGALGLDASATSAALTGGTASARVAGLSALLGIQMELATAGFDDLLELEEEGDLPEEFELVEGPEGGAPGLREFYGRSEDE